MDLVIVLAFIVLGYLTGSYFEKRHYKSIIDRETKYQALPVISSRWENHISVDEEGQVFGSGMVVASDYFKTFVTGLRNIVGGRMNAYESLIDRGRREVILRVKEKATGWGATKIVNLRIETATIGNSQSKRGLPCVELFAYGTAIRPKENQSISS